jgi:hypothetical protein
MHPPPWEYLKREGPIVHRGCLHARSRNIGLPLATAPKVARLDEVATELENSIFFGGWSFGIDGLISQAKSLGDKRDRLAIRCLLESRNDGSPISRELRVTLS